MRWSLVLAALLASKGALAQGDSQPTSERAWSDFTQEDSAISSASMGDCATACKALESLARAAQHICDVAPEHCEEARARLRAATDRVRSACPQCEVRAQAPIPTQDSARGERVTVQSAPSHGGCAGCTTASTSSPDFLALAGLSVLAAFALGRRRRRASPDQ